MTLYRIDLMAAKGEDDFQGACDMEQWLVEKKVLVPVVPCVHGNYAPHIIGHYERVWCDGKRVGEEPQKMIPMCCAVCQEVRCDWDCPNPDGRSQEKPPPNRTPDGWYT